MREKLKALGRAVFVLAVVGSLAVGTQEVLATGSAKEECENCQSDEQCRSIECCGTKDSFCPVPNSGAKCLCA